MNKFIIECRYESFTSTGKKFNNWYVLKSSPVTETEGNELIKTIKKDFAYIDQKTKLKHEYRLVPYEEYLKTQKELNERLIEANKEHEEYLKSDEYKELQKKKRQAAKERKERQKKYMEEHGL